MDKYILVKTTNADKLKAALQAVSNAYSQSGIQLNRLETTEETFIITFKKEPDFEYFQYYVNYLFYPETGEFSKEIFGYCNIPINQSKFPSIYYEKRVMLFVPESDTEGDNVYGVFEHGIENYKFGFAMGHEFVQLNDNYQKFHEPKFTDQEMSLIQEINPQEGQKNISKNKGCLMTLTVILLIAVISIL